MRVKFAFLVVLIALSCRERINPYDPGGESFVTPPPIYFARPTLGWYNPMGYLIGVRVQVDFVDAFDESFSIINVLYRGNEELVRRTIPVSDGIDSYEIDLITDTVMDAGDYLVVFYWGDISIGSCLFGVIIINGNPVIQNVTEYETVNVVY
jgi:hypothetical protein